MRLSTVAIGATLRVQDSLAEGASRFYAEITRLKQVIDLAGKQPPLLFLLDEVLAGTNSHDRLQGAEALIRALVSKGAIGVVTTHDLALARAADDLKPRARNAHFADDVVNGQLSFDYTLREGVVTRSNAIALMRAVGLPLD
jgi:DNA mismatch repair ATPase MutS